MCASSFLTNSGRAILYCVKFRQHPSVRGLAGHSHYHNVKHRKAAVDEKRQTHFQKLSDDIHGAIMTGGRDPSSNPRLARAIEVAKKAGMPNKRIENVLSPSSSVDLTNTPTAVYYGVLPHSVVVRVTALQARPRAIASEMRSLFRRAGGDLEKGGWQFKDSYCVTVQLRGNDEGDGVDKGDTNMVESIVLVAMECDVTDITEDGKNNLRLVCTSAGHSNAVAESLAKTFQSLAQRITCVHDIRPTSFVVVEDEATRKSFDILTEKLSAHSDVIDVIHNVQL